MGPSFCSCLVRYGKGSTCTAAYLRVAPKSSPNRRHSVGISSQRISRTPGLLLGQVYMSLTLLVAAALATSIACGNAAGDWLEPDAQDTSDAEDEVMFDVAG